MNVNLIYAKSLNNVIGNRGKLPWHIPEDLAYFSKVTKNEVVVMGARTWQSLPNRFKPLPGRINVVVTTNASLMPEMITRGAVVFCDKEPTDIRKIIRHFKGAGKHADLWVIGGSTMYEQALPYADYAYVTEIQAEYPGDTFAPTLDSGSWIQQSSETVVSDTGPTLKYCIYKNEHVCDIDRIELN